MVDRGAQRGVATRHHADALLAVQVNGADLSLDHGFPARIVVPALPRVHNTKWVTRMTYQADRLATTRLAGQPADNLAVFGLDGGRRGGRYLVSRMM